MRQNVLRVTKAGGLAAGRLMSTSGAKRSFQPLASAMSSLHTDLRQWKATSEKKKNVAMKSWRVVVYKRIFRVTISKSNMIIKQMIKISQMRITSLKNLGRTTYHLK